MTVSSSRYCLGSFQILPLGSESVLLRRQTDGAVRILSRRAASALGHFRSFTASIPPSAAALVADWVAQGVLVSERELRLACARRAPEARRSRIGALVIVTANRPECLARCVESHLESDALDGREVLVFDDSSEEATRAANRAVLQELRRRHGGEIRYAGLVEKKTYLDAMIAAADVPGDVLRFALWGSGEITRTLGGNRNAALLETADQSILFADDDTTADVMHAPGGGGLAMEARSPIGDFWFHAGLEDARRSATWRREPGIFGIHEALLGASVAELVATRPESESLLGDWGGESMGPVLSGRARVLATQMGVVGDTGADSPFGYLLLEGASRQRLLRSEADYRVASTSRVASRRVLAPTLSTSGFCMAHVLGLDNRLPLPPFVPVGRNTDGIFGATLRQCHPEGSQGYLPDAVWHDPPEPRAWLPEDIWRGPAVWRIPEAIAAMIGAASVSSSSAEPYERMQALGRNVAAFGARSPEELAATLHREWSRRAHLMLGELERALAAHDAAPPCWARDVERAIRLTHELASSGGPPALQDVPAAYCADGGLDVARRLAASFGQLLVHWEELTAAARALRHAGTRMTVPIR